MEAWRRTVGPAYVLGVFNRRIALAFDQRLNLTSLKRGSCGRGKVIIAFERRSTRQCLSGPGLTWTVTWWPNIFEVFEYGASYLIISVLIFDQLFSHIDVKSSDFYISTLK
jgi:hypothetical protein